jgi:hypothetical protein
MDSLNYSKITRRKLLKWTGLSILTSGIISGGVFSYLNRRAISAVNNMLKMGHCAPSVMKTLLNADGSNDEDIVKLSGSLAGGIGNTGAECGAITASVIFLGLKNSNLNKIISTGKIFMKDFHNYNKFIDCNKNPNGTQSCIKAVSSSPDKIIKLNELNLIRISEPDRELLDAFNSNDFHCSNEVFHHLGITSSKILNACQGFIGGTLLSGMTCSALTAGVMAMGLQKGEIENSYLKVFRMLRMMGEGDKWLSDGINNFHRSIKLGTKLNTWFMNTYKTCKCKGISGCPFNNKNEVKNYIKRGGIQQCKRIAENVAREVRNYL